MMLKNTNGRIFAVCSLVLVWSLFSAAGALADRNEYHDHHDDATITDGTIYDAKTGLTWQQQGSDHRVTWAGALTYVESLNTGNFGGCKGWRLPTSKELERLVDHSKHSGHSHIDDNYFPSSYADFYWTSSSNKNKLKYAISFGDGRQRTMSSDNQYYVRAVRSDCGDPSLIDNDRDGYSPEGPNPDCDDNDPNIHPGAPETCGYVDSNCDGKLDLSCFGIDNDLDGYTEDQGDCDDRNRYVHPHAQEKCDGIDNNCDGQIDEGLTQDADGDGYYAAGSCALIKDPTLLADCDDSNPDVHPGATEICGDLVDQDCSVPI